RMGADSSQESSGEEYEIDRIIGRRASINKIEYLVFWKGYTMSDCTWEPLILSDSCEQAINEFETRCAKLRFEHFKNPSTQPIDMYENEGIATLLEDALELFADGSSVFQNEVSDFDFAAGGANSTADLKATPTGKNKRTARQKPAVATVGWNRKIRNIDKARPFGMSGGSLLVPGIQQIAMTSIVGAIKLPSGYRCYLTQWSDGELSWERPAAFDEAMGVLYRHESAGDASDRNALLMQYRRANKTGNVGSVHTPAKKTNLERMTGHSSLGSSSWATGSLQAPLSITESSTSQLPLMFDLSTSSLLKTKPTASSSGSTPSPDLSKNGDILAASSFPVLKPKPVTSLPNGSKSHSKLVVAESSDDDVEMHDEVILSARVAAQKPASKSQTSATVSRSDKFDSRFPYVAMETSIGDSLVKRSVASLSAERRKVRLDIARSKEAAASSSGNPVRHKKITRGHPPSRNSSDEITENGPSSIRARRSVSDRLRRLSDRFRHRKRMDVFDDTDTDSNDELVSGSVRLARAKNSLRSNLDKRVSVVASRLNSRTSTPDVSSASSESYVARTTIDEPNRISEDSVKCDFCSWDIKERADRVHCSKCQLVYHTECYKKVVKRVGVDSATGSENTLLLDGRTCALCMKFDGDDFESVLTWRKDPQSTRVIGSGVYPPDFDVYVKWKSRSYQNASWVPFIWLSKFRKPHQVKMLKLKFGIGSPPTIKDSFDQSYLLPAAVIGAVPIPSSWKDQRVADIQSANALVSDTNMYTHYEMLRIAWTNLDLDQATLEPVPNPLVNPEQYDQLYPLFKAWELSEAVSLTEHLKLASKKTVQTKFSPFKVQPEYLRGGTMFDYQIDGVNWLLYQRNCNKAAILADDPGLGKTIQTIAFLSAIYYSTVPEGLRDLSAAKSNLGTFPFLLIVPVTLVENWMAEFRKWAPFLAVTTLSGRAANRNIQFSSTIFRQNAQGKFNLRCHVLLTSYEAFSQTEAQQQFKKVNITWEAV
ncbi:hypothetical protein GGI05_002937, partial [Coemansia sp. RSA 2603]